MNIKLTNPQTKVFRSKAKAIAAVAGFGSGKTQVALIRMIATMFEFPRANMLYLAPTFPLIRDIWYPKVEEFLTDLGLGFKINKSEHVIYIHGHGKIYCRTMENPSRIVGFEILDAFLDELDILPEEKAIEVIRKTKARMRQKIKGKDSQMYVTTTPEGYKATYKMFKKDPLPNSELIQMSTYSNAKNLPDGYIDDLKGSYPSQLIEAYLNGIFVNLTAMPVWCEFQRDLHDSKEKVKKSDNSLIVGMDFNVGRGCAVIFVRRGKELHAVDEVVNSYDTPDTIRVLQERYPSKTITVYPDASGKSRKSVNATISDFALLKEAGYTIKALNRNPNIKDRIIATNTLFMNGCGERNLYVNIDRCPNLADALEQQVYDDNGLPEKGEGKGDDITDAFSYPVAYLHPVKKIIATRTELVQVFGG